MSLLVRSNIYAGDAVKKTALILLTLATLFCFTLIGLLHQTGEAYGWISLLPTSFVLILALWTKRTVESLLSGAILGLLIIDPSNIVTSVVSMSQKVMMDKTIAWLLLVCGLMGGLIVILEKGGSVLSFSIALGKRIKTRRQAMVVTFCMGVLIFLDDYLNAIAISSSMKRLTDRYKISREKLSYLVDSTAAPVCIMFPISTWALFFVALLESNQVAPEGRGMHAYISAIPYMAYGWVTLLVVFCMSMQWLPDLGTMKKAEKRAQEGQPIPDGAVDIDFSQGVKAHSNSTIGVLNFILPMLVLVLASWYFEIDLLAGVIVAIAFTFFLYSLQSLVPVFGMFEAIYDGIKIMLLPLATVFGGFLLKDVNDQLGLTPYVIDSVVPWLSASLFPAIVFLVMLLLVFATASSWGLFAIAIPVVMPIGIHLGVPVPITIGALVSASAAGSHACFFSDSTVLAAQGSGCTAMQHALTQFPYVLIGVAATTGFFLFSAWGL